MEYHSIQYQGYDSPCSEVDLMYVNPQQSPWIQWAMGEVCLGSQKTYKKAGKMEENIYNETKLANY